MGVIPSHPEHLTSSNVFVDLQSSTDWSDCKLHSPIRFVAFCKCVGVGSLHTHTHIGNCGERIKAAASWMIKQTRAKAPPKARERTKVQEKEEKKIQIALRWCRRRLRQWRVEPLLLICMLFRGSGEARAQVTRRAHTHTLTHRRRHQTRLASPRTQTHFDSDANRARKERVRGGERWGEGRRTARNECVPRRSRRLYSDCNVKSTLCAALRACWHSVHFVTFVHAAGADEDDDAAKSRSCQHNVESSGAECPHSITWQRHTVYV